MPDRAVTQIDRAQFRPFTLGDAMILIIALATGLSFARSNLRVLVFQIPRYPLHDFLTRGVAVPLGRALTMLMLHSLYFLLPAYLILRLKRPRAPLRSLIRQPGMAACAALGAVLLVLLLVVLLLRVLVPLRGLTGEVVGVGSLSLIVVAAPLAWVALMVTHQWHPEPHWIDRLGRVLGGLWTVSALAGFFLF
jgi:hypothetical protein